MALEAPPIRKLTEEVINRIAAGEVIQRPANALKELLENSLDAKSTNIQVTVKNGGLKLLQIQDNGVGIRKDDFEIVCERFTTSKLREFEDLQKISTYGFRGEALASISHVAHLSITSKTADAICAYYAEFTDGKLKCSVKPMAGNQGTIIRVEDLFYNMSVRKKALRQPAEEYQKISDVISKYAIHNATVGFALKKSEGSNDIRTPPNSTITENIKIIYGNSIARELIEFHLENNSFNFKVSGFMTNVNYSTKKFQFLLFINHRLVDCQNLKKCIDNVYQTYLPKNSHPFVYLGLELDPNNIDVNVHPTKHEVHFLNEEQIIENIITALETKLLGSNNSRAFFTQAKLPRFNFETNESVKEKDGNNTTIHAKDMVRTDASEQKLEKFFGASIKKTETDIKNKNEKIFDVSISEDEFNKKHDEFLRHQESFETKCLNKTQDLIFSQGEIPKSNTENQQIISPDIFESNNNPELFEKPSTSSKNPEKPPLNKHFIAKVTRMETKLTSVLELRKSVEENCHKTLRETFAQHVFVGSIDPSKSLIQYGTKLLLCNTKIILQEFFYQLILYNFQNFDYYKFEGALCLKELALTGLELPETGWTIEDGPKDELAVKIVEILTEKAPMLHEYFSLEIDECGKLKSVPILLENYVPDLSCLPLYVIRLATEVDWENEKECFETFARETARFYINLSMENNGNDWKWITEHVIFPSLKEYFIPPKDFIENASVLEIADLPKLYKVFERC